MRLSFAQSYEKRQKYTIQVVAEEAYWEDEETKNKKPRSLGYLNEANRVLKVERQRPELREPETSGGCQRTKHRFKGETDTREATYAEPTSDSPARRNREKRYGFLKKNGGNK